MVRERRARRPQSGAKLTAKSIWDTPRIKRMREQPLGSPIVLTREEAIAIAREAFGKGRHWPSGADYVNQVKGIWRGLLKSRDG